jgi:thiol-disulfide isomerase/thioredoxin
VGLAILGTVLLVAWGDLGGMAFVKRTSGGVKFLVGLLAIAGMIGVMLGPRNLGRHELAAGDGKPVDLHWPLLNLKDGKEVDLDSLKGKVLFINVWATWCGPCIREMPSIESLYEQFARRDDVAFILVSTDDSPETVKRSSLFSKMKAPIYFPRGPMPRDFRTDGIPATFIVAKDGTLAKGHVGEANWSGEGKFIEKLAKAPAPSAEAKR